MKKALKFALGGLLLATPALAQDGTAAAGGTEGEQPADPTAAAAPAEPAPAPATETAPAAAGGMMGGWARSLIERQYGAPAGKVGAYGAFSVLKLSFTNPITMTSSSATFDALGIGAGYGINDKLTAGAQYAITPGLFDADTEVKGALGLFGQYQVMHDSKLSLSASGSFTLNLCGSRDAMGGCGTTKGLDVGVGARYTVAPKMAVFTGAPVGPGPVGQHLSISLESGGPITLALPVGFMYQATPELNVQLGTSLGTIGISNSDSAFFGADFIPVTVGALYSVNGNIDAVVGFSLPDVKEAGFDLMSFTVGARYNQ